MGQAKKTNKAKNEAKIYRALYGNLRDNVGRLKPLAKEIIGKSDDEGAVVLAKLVLALAF